jgi:hypothetical protein
MKKPTLDRIVAARRLYFMAKQTFAEGTDSGAFCAALLLQDSVEVFLLATAIETGAISQREGGISADPRRNIAT